MEPTLDTLIASPETGSTRKMTLNMGPQHPSTHGVLRIVLELDGETILTANPDIGYLHTGIEKEFEVKLYAQGTPLTDRVDYLDSARWDGVTKGHELGWHGVPGPIPNQSKSRNNWRCYRFSE